MEVDRIRALRGPNLWCRHTALEAVVTCQAAEISIANSAGFEDRLRARFPEIDVLQPTGKGSPVSLAQVLELATLRLQATAGCPVTFSRCSPTLEPGTFQIVVEYSEEVVGRLALELAQALCVAAANDGPFELHAALTQLRELDEEVRLGPSTGAIVNAGVARGIPYRRLTEGSLVQFGWGSRQRRIQAADTDRTSVIAETLAQDKELTKSILASAGIPVPGGRPVVSAEDAVAAAREIGDRVVVKPRFGNQGKGVTVNIETPEQITAAYASARERSDEVLVERFIPGHDYRVLVVGNAVVAAARREPPHVNGDGLHNVRELIDEVNSDPRRGSGHATALTKIKLDEIARASLADQGYDVDSIPPRGARVILRNNSNLSTGGTATDVTDDVHPELAARAIEAAQAVGLDVCGVDVVCESVLKPLEAQSGGIVEVNAAPGLRMHLAPAFGKSRPVGEAIISTLFGPGEDGRIPVVAVTGTNGKTTTVRLIAHLLTGCGLRVGMTTTDGVYVADQRIDTGDCSGPRSARSVLSHPDVDAAVLETARGGLLREGLGFDRCRVAVVTNIGKGDHLGLNFITNVDDLSVLKRVIVQNVAPDGYAVLNAADSITAGMAVGCPGAVIFFAADRTLPLMATHQALGRRVVFVENEAVVAMEGGVEHRLSLARVPLTRGGALGFQVENVMAAVAAAWALEIDWQLIAAGLSSFNSDVATAPGRFNVFDYRGATLIADYGHNPDAIGALVKAVEALPARRRTVVISGAGDRRDEDILGQSRILGDAFDHVILYEDQCQRGRADGEVIKLLRDGLAGAKRTRHIEEIKGEFRAIDTALAALKPGDLCLILIDQVEAALAYLTAQVASSLPDVTTS